MIDDRRPLPESVGALAHVAIRAYYRRFGLYFGVAFVGLLGEGVLAYVRPGDEGFFYAGSIFVDSFVAALVTLGVVADMRETERPSNAVLTSHAFERWGIVATVTMLVDIFTYYTTGAVFGPPDATAYGFLILPTIVLWGSISFATVIAAVDQKAPAASLALGSIGRSAALGLSRRNLGRLTVLALVAMLPLLVEGILADQLALRKIAGWELIANIPIDALTNGPLQALYTVFYLDFVRRSAAPRSS